MYTVFSIFAVDCFENGLWGKLKRKEENGKDILALVLVGRGGGRIYPAFLSIISGMSKTLDNAANYEILLSLPCKKLLFLLF